MLASEGDISAVIDAAGAHRGTEAEPKPGPLPLAAGRCGAAGRSRRPVRAPQLRLDPSPTAQSAPRSPIPAAPLLAPG